MIYESMILTDAAPDLALFLCLAVAGLWDFGAGRVPNGWLAFWLLTGFWYYAYSGWLAAAGYLVRTAAAVSILFLLFLSRMLGAADLKCMALICGYLGFRTGFVIIGLGWLFGACFSLYRMVRQRDLGKRMVHLVCYIRHCIQTKHITAYYMPERDEKNSVIPLVFFLWLGMLAFEGVRCAASLLR